MAEFFAPMKKRASDAHKEICNREKMMLSPLQEAEKALKNKMAPTVWRRIGGGDWLRKRPGELLRRNSAVRRRRLSLWSPRVGTARPTPL